MLICKFCNKECKNENSLRNHERLCPHNKDRKYVSYTIGHTAWNKGLSCDTDKRVKQSTEKMIETKKNLPVTGCAAWSREKLSAEAKRRGFGGYRPNAGRSKKFKVVDSFGKETTLQSTYELLCSELLNEMNIKWVRPKALKYDGRNYFADFYLPDYNIYLDPKNSYKAKLDADKIKKVVEENNVKVFVLLQEQITKEYIGRLTEMD